MEIPKRQRHALEAVVQIACHAGSEPLSSRSLADAQEVRPRYLEQLLQQLVRAGILKGVRGPKGGYVLAREKRRISLADILYALDDGAPKKNEWSPLGERLVAPIWQEIDDACMHKLSSMHLADLCSAIPASALHPKKEQRSDFVI